ncbi:MAG: glutamine-hydrolyzing GMP synthase [Eubacteriales bacterium]|nr:glutamine-hydrolyzing GMP synthase [Eubacteriales bacterium]
MKHQAILILDFGGQYNQLIARRVRENSVFCEVLPYTTSLETIRERGYAGIILTGGPNSVNIPSAPRYDAALFDLGIPILGICYGAQLMAATLGGRVESMQKREYGRVPVEIVRKSPFFSSIEHKTICWMSHTDQITVLPDGFHVSAKSENCPIAAMEDPERRFYAVQFHPEVQHTPLGSLMLTNFLFGICGCSGDWKMDAFVEESIAKIRQQVSDRKVICALSGGVDSSVAAVMVHQAIGDRLICIFVDHGLLRKDEGDLVEKVFREQFSMNLIRVNAQQRFLDRLAGVTDPETKRKIIGEEFIRVFEEEAKKIGEVDFLVQGTIYPDVIESGLGDAAVIKSHHNVGGLPDTVDFVAILEPLRDLFKDEVRKAGLEMGIPGRLVWRQPFPGPGLAIRVIGEITEEKLEILREADAIFREEVDQAGLNQEVSQYFAVLTGIRSVGVMGDERTYDHTIALRAVTTTDFMTADWAQIPHDVLSRVSNRIVNEVRHVNRIVYDITSKPPATIEWE